jgi:ribosome-associated translation inhibitor RaiA
MCLKEHFACVRLALRLRLAVIYEETVQLNVRLNTMNLNNSQTPSALYALINELIVKLQAQKLNAKPLQDVQTAAFTTSSEWLGELGKAVREVQKQKIKDETITSRLSQIMDAVHAAWPRL